MVLACVKYKRTTRKAKAAALLLRETREEELAAIRAEGEAEVKEIRAASKDRLARRTEHVAELLANKAKHEAEMEPGEQGSER